MGPSVLAFLLALLFLALLWAITLFFGLPLWIAAASSVCLLLVLGARFAYGLYRAKQASLEIERSLARQAKQFESRARPDQLSEARALAANFEKALATLKSSRLARGRGGALYSLPWYVIIGPPGAGKSTAIRQSGLKFPLLGGQNAVRGIGGTRNCDWWLSNEAVLLDTAGRYATEDDDREEWLAFLDILKRSRPRRPLNGLIVALSAAELAASSDAQLEALASKIRERVDEVMGRLELVLPVYVLLTKCDLLPGFMETFEDLKRTERAQVFGFTFPLHDRSELAPRAEQQWIRLEQVVERSALRRMAEVRSPESRQRIFEFPQQLEALRPKVSALLSATFVDNVYQDAPIVRGVYLTSGAQVGNLVDQLMGSMAAAFGLPPPQSDAAPRAESKSFFLGDLFRLVMFPDQEVAARSALGQRRRELARLAIAAALSLGALGPLGLAVRAYAANRGTIVSARGELAAALAYREDQKAAVPLAVLEPIRARLAQLSRWEREGAPWSQRMGLYEGDALLPYLHSFYTATLRDVLMQPLVLQIAGELSQSVRRNAGLGNVPSVTDQALTYERLRAYLLLTSPREPSTPPLHAEVRKWLTSELVDAWAARTQGSAPSPAEREAMGVHVAFYLELLAQDEKLGFVHDPQLISGARELLGRVPAVKLAVDRVVATLEPLGWDLGLEHLVGSTGLPLTATGRIRGAFTRRAWDEHLRALFSSDPQALLGDSWVFAGSEGKTGETDQTRLCALRSEYFGRYVAEWRDFIGTLRMEEPLDHARAGAVLQDLTRGQPPPLERVMRAVAFHAQLLAEEKKQPSQVEQAAEGTGLLDRLTELRKKAEASPLGGLIAKKNACVGAEYVTEASVRAVLSGFFSFGASLEEPQAGAPAPLTSVQIYQEQLSYVRDALQSYADDPSTSDALLARLQAARTRVRSLIETQEIGFRPRFDALLWPPINGASFSSSAAMAGEKGSRWCTSVLSPFARTLRERYPFTKNGQDVALADLAEFYRPNSGILWSFYDAVLKRDVTQLGSKFQLALTNNTSMYENELVRFLDRSLALTTALFPARAEKPRVDFELRVRPSPGIAQVLLTIDGQLVDFHNGPEKWVRITWPGEGGKPGAQMRVKGASIDETLGQEGEWGLFRLLDKGTISANPGERFFTARWRLHTQNDVTIDIRPARSENPFVGPRAYLEAFRADGVIAPSAIAVGAKPCSE